MSKVVINDTTLSSIAFAIRAKNGEDKLYKPGEMADAIYSIKGSDELETLLHYTGDCSYLFYGANWKTFLEKYGHLITTENISNMSNMLANNANTNIPFSINLTTFDDKYKPIDCSNAFAGASKMETLPAITGRVVASDISSFFEGCKMLNDDITFNWIDWEVGHRNVSDYPDAASKIFCECMSLREIPEAELSKIYTYSSVKDGNTSAHTYYMFKDCHSLDEIRGLRMFKGNNFTSNAFGATFNGCWRVKDIIFAQDDTVYSCSNQTINLTLGVGYVGRYDNTDGGATVENLLSYNNGITEDKLVRNATAYASLKNNPDWFSDYRSYSRYNHDSAVNTINSLPNVSGGTGNVIKFEKDCGKSTDGGAISKLTSAEIAVATAKGWTVSYI